MYTHVTDIEIDTTTNCNAFCPACVRYISDTTGVYKNKNLKYNQNISLDSISKLVEDPYFPKYQKVKIELIGTAGDPMAHPQIIELVKIIKQVRPNWKIILHTNGGLRSEKVYEELAQYMNHNDKLCFSMDGLADTNHIYRRNVDWNKVQKNIHAFKNNNLNDVRTAWNYIIFPWNKHQIKQAEEMSKEMGFTEFTLRNSRNSPEEDIELINLQDYTRENQYLGVEDGVVFEYDYIVDECFSKNKIFLDQHAIVYPCCNWASIINFEFGNTRDQLSSFIGNDKWNDFSQKSLTEILTHSKWADLKSSLDSNPINACVNYCGVKDCSFRRPNKSFQ